MAESGVTSPRSRKREQLTAETLPMKQDHEWLAVQVELPPSVETEQLLPADEDKPTPPRPSVRAPAVQASLSPAWLQSDLEFAQIVLRGMAVASTVRLVGAWVHSSRWETLMKTADFIDYAPASTQQLILLPHVAAIIMWVSCELVVHYGFFNHRHHLVPVYNRALVALGYASALGVVGFLAYGGEFSQATMMRFAVQTDAVTAFNQEFCRSWCRNKEAGLGAFMRGDCGANVATVFDDMLLAIDVKDWCQHAIAKQNYELVADYDGVAPFAGLKELGGNSLTDIVVASLSSVITLFGGILFISCPVTGRRR